MSTWMTPQQLSEDIGIAVGTLANWRSQGIGPKPIRVGRLVRYETATVEAWKSTFEAWKSTFEAAAS